MLSTVLRKIFGRRPAPRRCADNRSVFRPRLEILEARVVPSTADVYNFSQLQSALGNSAVDTIKVHGTIDVPASTQLTFSQSKLTLTGADCNAAIRSHGDYAGGAVLTVGSGTTKFVMNNLTFDGCDSTHDTGLRISLNSSGKVVVNNNEFVGDDVGVLLSGSSKVQVLNNDFESSGQNGIQDNGGSQNTLTGNEICDSDGDGLLVSCSDSDTIKHNQVEGSLGNGVHLLNTTSTQLINNDIELNGVNGIFIECGGNNTVLLSCSDANRQDGINLTNTVNNTISASAQLLNGGYGISLHGAQNTTIQGDLAQLNGQGGINIDLTTSFGTILSNINTQTGGDAFVSWGWSFITDDVLQALAACDC